MKSATSLQERCYFCCGQDPEMLGVDNDTYRHYDVVGNRLARRQDSLKDSGSVAFYSWIGIEMKSAIS